MVFPLTEMNTGEKIEFEEERMRKRVEAETINLIWEKFILRENETTK